MATFITVQPSPRIDGLSDTGQERTQLPYPFHVEQDGSVLRQDFWRGDPKRVVGFQRDLAKQQIDLYWSDAWKDPEQAIGMYVVTQAANGQMSVQITAIQSMKVTTDESQET